MRARLQTWLLRNEFARFVHLARKAFNIKLGLSNAMLSLFSHMGDFTPVHAKPSFCSTAGPTLCVARSFSIEAMLHSTATPHARLGRRKRSSAPHSRDHSLSAPVNLQLLRCEHDETDRVAPSGALLWTRGWHPKPIMLHGARKADSPPKFKKASPSLTFAQGSNGTPHATSPRGSQPGASIKTRRRIHECNGLCACAYPPAGPNALEAEERWPPSHW